MEIEGNATVIVSKNVLSPPAVYIDNELKALCLARKLSGGEYKGNSAENKTIKSKFVQISFHF